MKSLNSHSRLTALAMLLACLTVGVVTTSPAFAIKKCKDADGQLHYGDTAVEECENSKITTLTERGFIKDEEEAPKTEEQLQAEQEELTLLEREQRDRLAAEEEKRRILSIYETEDDIDRQRDNQVRSVQSNIDVHESYLSNMEKRVARYEKKLAAAENEREKEQLAKKISNAKQRMSEYSEQLTSLEKQKKEILARFKQERETYLALKNSSD